MKMEPRETIIEEEEVMDNRFPECLYVDRKPCIQSQIVNEDNDLPCTNCLLGELVGLQIQTREKLKDLVYDGRRRDSKLGKSSKALSKKRDNAAKDTKRVPSKNKETTSSGPGKTSGEKQEKK